jgi:hypothetical protein
MKIEDGYLKLDLDKLFSAMPEETQKEFIKSFAVEETVIEHVIDYICGEDPDGWWTGYASDLRFNLLERVEKTQLKNWSKYNWSVFSEISQALRDIRCKQQLYWQLVYHPNDEICWKIMDWMKSKGIESNFTTKQADDDIARIEKLIRDKLEGFAKNENKSEARDATDNIL